MSRTDKSSTEKKVKVPSALLHVTFFCGSCEKNVVRGISEVHFSASEQDCELCGSHGDTRVDFTCPDCKKSHTIELSSW